MSSGLSKDSQPPSAIKMLSFKFVEPQPVVRMAFTSLRWCSIDKVMFAIPLSPQLKNSQPEEPPASNKKSPTSAPTVLDLVKSM
jgi:hypothetical protein